MNAQFSFVTIYKVGKCMMPSVLKICSDFKSCVVYSSLHVRASFWQRSEECLKRCKHIAELILFRSLLHFSA